MSDPTQVPTPKTRALMVHFNEAEIRYRDISDKEALKFRWIVAAEEVEPIERQTIRQQAIIAGLLKALNNLNYEIKLAQVEADGPVADRVDKAGHIIDKALAAAEALS